MWWRKLPDAKIRTRKTAKVVMGMAISNKCLIKKIMKKPFGDVSWISTLALFILSTLAL